MIFCNTTPFISLACIHQLELLPQVLGEIHVVSEVIDECAVGGVISVPDLRILPWVREVTSLPVIHTGILLELDKGEKHTIDMAKRMGAEWVIIDEKLGRNVAEYLGMRVMGTLGILLKAKQQGLIVSFRDSVNAMLEMGIRYHPALIEKLARTAGE